FVKLNNRPTNSESSSGLGLFIVKELLKKIKGEVSVESTLGAGSTFILKLPFAI
ncbi:MAG TPA: ATP-binding protein, partial [Pelobium sp.]|nr:ATP-binding protein [Pelobium sp.]